MEKLTESQKEEMEERIAIMIYDGGLSEEHAMRLAYQLIVEKYNINQSISSRHQ